MKTSHKRGRAAQSFHNSCPKAANSTVNKSFITLSQDNEVSLNLTSRLVKFPHWCLLHSPTISKHKPWWTHDSTMYPNPFDRKHSTIRQVLDRIFREKSVRKNVLSRKNSNTSSCSASSSESRSMFGFSLRWVCVRLWFVNVFVRCSPLVSGSLSLLDTIQ